jgi:hypothetical protein
MAGNTGNQTWEESMSEQENGDCVDVTYGIINGVFIRKVPMTVVVYPEIAEQIEQLIRTLEHVYELGIRRGMIMKEYAASSGSNNCTCSKSNNDNI